MSTNSEPMHRHNSRCFYTSEIVLRSHSAAAFVFPLERPCCPFVNNPRRILQAALRFCRRVSLTGGRGGHFLMLMVACRRTIILKSASQGPQSSGTVRNRVSNTHSLRLQESAAEVRSRVRI